MANDATVAELVLKLKDEMTGGADAAAKAFQRLRDQIKGDERELNEMKKSLKQLSKVTGSDTSQAMKKLQEQIAGKEQAIGVARGAFVELGGSFEDIKPKARGFSARLQELSANAKQVPGPLGSIADGIGKYTKGITSAQLRTVLLTSAFVGLTAAMGFGLKKLFDVGLASSEAARKEHLHLEALTKLRNMWGIAPGNADDMQASLDRVSASVSIGRDKVMAYQEQLYRAGLRGTQLEDALQGASMKASALGDSAGSSFVGLATTVARTGGSVKKFSEDVRARFGGIVDKQMKSSEVQALKQHEAMASMFGGLKIERFLSGMQQLRGMLSQSTASGRALKRLFETLMNPIFDALSNTKPLQLFFHGMIIGAQEITIAFLIVRNWFRKTFGSDTEKTIAGTSKALGIGKIAVYTLAAAFAVLAVNTLIAFWPFVLGAAVIAGFLVVLSDVIDFWDQINWSDMGSAVIDGFVGGLKAGYQMIGKELSNLAETVKSKFKSLFGIASPSKVFADLGATLPEGVAVGIKREAPSAQSAADSMLRPTLQAPRLERPNTTPKLDALPAREAPSPSVSPVNRSTSVSIGELHIHSASDKPREFALALRRQLEDVLEGVALEVGGA